MELDLYDDASLCKHLKILKSCKRSSSDFYLYIILTGGVLGMVNPTDQRSNIAVSTGIFITVWEIWPVFFFGGGDSSLLRAITF